jgi:hypothetical protein
MLARTGRSPPRSGPCRRESAYGRGSGHASARSIVVVTDTLGFGFGSPSTEIGYRLRSSTLVLEP